MAHQRTTREQHQAERRRARDAAESREDRGLPHHPDGSGYAPCPRCKGDGFFVVNNTNPCGHGPDPQCDEDVPCPECYWRGEIEDGRGPDPLVALRRARAEYRLFGTRRQWEYQHARRVAMRPTSGLAAVAMRAMAQRCVNRMDRLLATARAAA